MIKQVTKRGETSWQYDTRDPEGKRLRVHGFRTKKDAETALGAKRIEWLNEKHNLPTTKKTVSELNLREQLLLEADREDNLATDYSTKHHAFAALKLRKYAELLPEDLLIIDLKKQHIKPITESVRNGNIKNDTANIYLGFLKNALVRIRKRHEELEDWSVPPSDWFYLPAENISRQKVISNKEITQILNTLENPPSNANIMYNSISTWQDVADVMRIAMLTGMRKTEITSLSWKDVHMELSVMKVQTLKQRKGKPLVRDVPILNELRAILKRRKKNIRQTTWVFERWETDKQSQWIYRALIRACELLKIPYGAHVENGIFLHAARHTAASKMLLNGTDVKTASEILGNTPETLMRRYAHTTFAAKKTAVEGLSINPEK